MDKVYELLIIEKANIERELEFERNQLDIEFRKNFDRELCSKRGYIDISETSLNKKEEILRCANNVKTVEAKKYILDRIIDRYGHKCCDDRLLNDREDFNNITFTCDRLYEDNEGRYTRGMLCIAGFAFDCPFEMSFDEYSGIYLRSLYCAIIKLLKDEEEIIDVVAALEQACAQIIEEERENNR